MLVVDRLCPYTENQIQGSQFKTYIDEMVEFLESIKKNIAQNYSLISRFQEDVIVVRRLQKLTQLIVNQCVN